MQAIRYIFNLIAFALVLLFLCCVAIVFLFLFAANRPPPSDERLIKAFTERRSDFETLITMCSEGALDFSDASSTRQRLLDELGLMSLRCYEDKISITAYARGFSPEGGIYKGYVYFTDGLPTRLVGSVVENLEYKPKVYEPWTKLYRKIDDNWYLFFLY